MSCNNFVVFMFPGVGVEGFDWGGRCICYGIQFFVLLLNVSDTSIDENIKEEEWIKLNIKVIRYHESFCYSGKDLSFSLGGGVFLFVFWGLFLFLFFFFVFLFGFFFWYFSIAEEGLNYVL